MKALRSLLAGLWRALSSPLLTGVLWLGNLVAALMFGAIFFTAIGSDGAGYAEVGGRGELFDYVWWLDFRQAEPVFLETLTHLSGWLVLLGLVAHTFLIGGVLEILDTARRKFTMRGFFDGCGRRFLDFLGLLVLELALLWGLDLLWNDMLGGWLDETIREGLLDERWALALDLGEAALFVAAFYIVRTGFDYARVRAVVEGRESVLLSALAGWAFLLRHPWSVFLLVVGMGTLHIPLIAGVVLAEPLLPGSELMGGLTAVAALFVLHQVYVLLALGLRVSDYAAKIELFRRIRRSGEASLVPAAPAPSPEPAEEDEELLLG